MKKWLMVLLCAFFMFSGLTACSNSEHKENQKDEESVLKRDLILGKWETEVDMTKMMEEIFASDESMGEFIKVSDFKMKFFFTFENNSLMKLEVDETTLAGSFDKFFAGMKQSMHDYFESMIEESEVEMTVDELLEKSNLDLDTLVKDMSDAAMKAMKFEEMSYDCYYEIRYNRLYSFANAEERNDEEYIEIDFPDENTLKFVRINTEDKDNILGMISELKKVAE